MDLRARFHELMTRLGADHAAIGPAFEALLAGYQSPPRFYHDINHIAAVLDQLDAAATHAPELSALADRARFLDTAELAIWYHDIVYDAKNTDNEAQSARVMQAAAAALGIDSAIIDEAAAAIEVTARHDTAATLLEKIVVDCDLHTLGADPAQYDRNTALIRREFAHVPEEVFYEKRNAFFAHYLTGPIYHTAFFKDRLEDRARANIIRMMAVPAPPAAPPKGPAP